MLSGVTSVRRGLDAGSGCIRRAPGYGAVHERRIPESLFRFLPQERNGGINITHEMA
jgi:cobalamin-dependent methionine synthase I